MKIAIDIDEVLAEFAKLYLNYVNKKEGKNIHFEDLKSYKFWESYNFSKEVSREYADEVSEFLEDIGVVDGARESIKYLKNNFELIFLTARPLKIKSKTLKFIQENFNIENPAVYFSSDFYDNSTKNKGDFCKENEIDFLIEVNPSFFVDYLGKGLKVFLLDKPWNRGISHENIIRCKHWGDLVGKLKEIENGN